MKALMIILGIIAVILILLMFPLKIWLDYGEETKLRAGYMFLKFTLYPEKPKKPKKKKPEKKKPEEEKPKEKKPGMVKQLLDKHGVSGIIDILKEAAAIVTDVLKKLGRHLYITRLNIRICVAGEDAADTAIKYGYVCSAVYLPVSVLREHSVVKKHSIDISAGFLAEKTAAELELTAKIRLLFLIPAMLSALFKAVKLLLKLRG